MRHFFDVSNFGILKIAQDADKNVDDIEKDIIRDFFGILLKEIGKEKFQEVKNKRQEIKKHFCEVLDTLGHLSYKKQQEIICQRFKEKYGQFGISLKCGDIGGIKIKSDGETIEFYDENGEKVYPGWMPISDIESVKLLGAPQYVLTYKDFIALKKMVEQDKYATHEKGEEESEINFKDIVKDAIEQGASDIHITYGYDNLYRIFFRIDGEYVEQKKYIVSLKIGKQLIKQIKNEATKTSKGKFSADKSYVPQDGKIVYPDIGMYGVDIRLVFIPDGLLEKESVVARLLISKEIAKPDFSAMGYGKDFINILNSIAYMSNGLVIISGQTGSGKSTLLSNIIAGIDESRKVITAEDPIEYRIAKRNVEQHQVFIPPADEDEKEEKVMGFKELAKAFKRADPNIVMIGETRKDKELVDTLLEMSEAGQLVFTTIHIVSAFEIYYALEKIFGLPFAMSVPAIKVSINQSLMRKLCPHCKVVDEGNENKEYLDSIEGDLRFEYKQDLRNFLGNENVVTYKKGDGCEKCGGSGYLGRVPIYEYLYPDIRMKEWIAKEKPSNYMIEQRSCELGRGKNKLSVFIEKLTAGEIEASPKFVPQILL